MPKNTLLFPPSFIFNTIGTESGISGLQIAVNDLAIASKSGAMRQAHALGTGGRNSIKNQNKGMPTLNSLLPTRSVGKYTVAPSIPTGTLGYFLGGVSGALSVQSGWVERFGFATNTLVPRVNAPTIGNSHFSIANITSGYLLRSQTIQRLSFQSESVVNIGGTLFPARFQSASLRNASRGYACSGWGSGFGTTYGTVDRLSFAGEVCVSIGDILQPRAGSFGFANRFNGYVAGGYNNGVNNALTNNIERFSFASEGKTNISATLISPKVSLSSWLPGTASASYNMGGQYYGSFPTNTDSPRQYYTNTVEKFLFVGETASALGITLSKGLASFAAIGNPTLAVMAGGLTYSDSYTTQNTLVYGASQVLALTFLTEVINILGVSLTQGVYGSMGLDNSSL